MTTKCFSLTQTKTALDKLNQEAFPRALGRAFDMNAYRCSRHKVSPIRLHNQKRNTTVVYKVLGLRRTLCDAYANCPEARYAFVWR